MKLSSKLANAKKVNITNGDKATLKAGRTKTLKGKVTVSKGRKQIDHIPGIRFVTTDPTVATVSASGKISAKAKGTCYVYALAINGSYDKIKLTVK